jgi:hypothetical protein
MASPAPIPPRPRRSVAGPLVLIVVGTVFLLATMGVLHWSRFGYVFAHYWPLLIILWGVVKLMEYQRAQREGTRAPGIGAGGVFLLVVLIVFGLAATQASRFNWGALRDEINIDDGDFELFGHAYSYDDHLDQPFPAGASLKVVNDHGAVNVNASQDEHIHVAIHKRINAENQEDADKWNAGTKPLINTSEHTVTLNANTQGAGDHAVSTDLDISVPRKASIVISTRRGDINLMGRDGDADISHQRGDVSVADVNGKVNLSLERSSARVSQVSSDVSVQGRGGDVSMEDIKGALRISGEFDSIKLAKIANAVSFKSARTDMEFSKLNGDLDMDSGDLRASDVVGPFRLLTRSKDVRLMGVSGDLRLQDENGAVEVRISKLGNLQVDNRSGEIQIYLPDKAGFQLDARARRGDIESDFSELKIDNSNDQATATGSVGAGGPRLVVNNERGGIEIRKGSSVAEVPVPPHAPKTPKAPQAPVEPTEN